LEKEQHEQAGSQDMGMMNKNGLAESVPSQQVKKQPRASLKGSFGR